MANGLLAPMMPTTDPQQSAANSLQQMQVQNMARQGLVAPGMLPGSPSPGSPQATSPYLGAGDINQLYGILAQGTEDPQGLGTSYVQQMQAQQQADPMQNVMRLFGTVNPHDYSPQSINEFYQHYMQTGQPRYDLLRDRERLSSTEEKALLDSYTAMQEAGGLIGRVTNLADRFQQAADSGSYTQGLFGSVDAWYKRNISGKQSDLDLLKTEYAGLKNSAVIQNLPPGVASDRDIAIAMEGWPPPNANPAYIASFLRGFQKMQVIKYADAMHRNNYISANQNMRYIGQDWAARGPQYILESLRSNGLQINSITSDETPQQYAQRLRQGLTTERVGGGAEITPTGQPGGDYVWKGKALSEMEPDERDQAYDDMIDSMLNL